jgi:hypothetical protein
MHWKIWFRSTIYQYSIIWINWECDIEGSRGGFSCFLPRLRKTEGFLLTHSTGAGQVLLVLVPSTPITRGRFHLGCQDAQVVRG